MKNFTFWAIEAPWLAWVALLIVGVGLFIIWTFRPSGNPTPKFISFLATFFLAALWSAQAASENVLAIALSFAAPIIGGFLFCLFLDRTFYFCCKWKGEKERKRYLDGIQHNPDASYDYYD